jgi:hypothetical protein
MSSKQHSRHNLRKRAIAWDHPIGRDILGPGKEERLDLDLEKSRVYMTTVLSGLREEP